MRRAITTFLLLSLLFLCALYLDRNKNKKLAKQHNKSNTSSNLSKLNINDQIEQDRYKYYVKDIEKYRLGIPLNEYHNPNAPYSNSYRLHPKSFVPGFRQPIDSIVPDDYVSASLQEYGSNAMFPEMNNPNCDPNLSGCMDMQKGYYSDLLN
jgi:hypothetical protein